MVGAGVGVGVGAYTRAVSISANGPSTHTHTLKSSGGSQIGLVVFLRVDAVCVTALQRKTTNGSEVAPVVPRRDEVSIARRPLACSKRM